MKHLAITLLFTILLCACKENEPIKIGFIVTLTGKLSVEGVATRNGVQLAVDEVNEKGGIHGRKIELITKDDKNNPEIAKKRDRELIDAGVVTIIGHFTSTITLAAVPLMNREKMLLISPGAATNKLTGIDDFFMRASSATEFRIKEQVNFTAKKLKIKKVAAIYDLSNRHYTEDWYNTFKRQYEPLGGKIVLVHTFTSGLNPDFVSLSANIAASKPQGVMLIANSVDSALIAQQLYINNFRCPIFIIDWAYTDDFIRYGGKSIEGVYALGDHDYNNRDKEYLDFKSRYMNRFGTEPTGHSMSGYETLMVLKDSLLRAKKITPEHIRQQIIAQRNFKGIQRDFYIDEYGDAHRQSFVFRVQDARFKRLSYE